MKRQRLPLMALVVAVLFSVMLNGCFLLKVAPFLFFGVNPFDLPPPCDQTDAGCPVYDSGPQDPNCLPGNTCNKGTVTVEPQ